MMTTMPSNERQTPLIQARFVFILLVQTALPTQSTYSSLRSTRIPFPKANETVSNVHALWATSIQSLLSFVHQSLASTYMDFCLYVDPIVHHNQ
jgi:hypothetical protein